MNTMLEKLLLFCGKSYVDTFSNFFKIAEVLHCGHVAIDAKK